MSIRVRVIGTNPPGRACLSQSNVHCGIQRKQEIVDRTPGDQAVTFEFDIEVRNGRFGGPYVHGKADERFIYLSWGEVDGDEFRMFRRAKLHLSSLDPADVDGRTIEARISLSDAKGLPVCASLRPPQVTWSTIR